MTTVTGFTAEHMQEILNEVIANAYVDGSGHLQLVKYDTSIVDAGDVTGPIGPVGPAMSFAGYEEPITNLGNVSGTVNLDLNSGNVFRINPTATVNITFSNLPAAAFVNSVTLIIDNATYAVNFPVGTKYPNGAVPVLVGETWLSMVARSTHVTVGQSWQGVA